MKRKQKIELRKEEFLINLPSEILISILSRLPVLIIVACKCVCRSLLNLLNSIEFAESHLSKPVQGLVVYEEWDREWFSIFELEDELDLEHHELRYIPVAKFHGTLIGGTHWRQCSCSA